MTLFWISAALAAALAAWLVLEGARRGAVVRGDGAESAELEALDRLKGEGQIDEDAYAAARAEAARRLLKTAPTTLPLATRPQDRLWAAGGAVGAAALALGLYALVGAPGAADQPYARRVAEWATRPETLEAPQLAAVMEGVTRERPADSEALRLLGAARFQAGDPIGAASAFRKALALNPDDAQSWARLGESLVRANGGEIGGDAEAAFAEAVRRDPNQLGALYFLGEAALARGEGARVRQLWGSLVQALPPSDPRRADLLARMPAAGAA